MPTNKFPVLVEEKPRDTEHCRIYVRNLSMEKSKSCLSLPRQVSVKPRVHILCYYIDTHRSILNPAVNTELDILPCNW